MGSPEELTGTSLDERLAEARELGERGREIERRGDPDGALELLERALALVADAGRHPVVADVLCWTGIAQVRLSQTSEAESNFHDSLAMAAMIGYVSGQAYAVNGLAVIAQRRGDTPLAESLFQRAGRLSLDSAEYPLLGMVEQNLGVIANIKGDLDGALVHYRKSLQAFELADNPQGICWVLNNMGMLQSDLGRFDRAVQTLSRGLEVAREHDDAAMEGLLELNRTEAFIGLGDWEAAGDACRRALEMAEELGDDLRRAEGLKYRAVIERERGSAAASAEFLQEAYELAVSGEDALLCAEVLTELGATWLARGESGKARPLWQSALDQFRDLNATRDADAVAERLRRLDELQ